jgi:hypothetical protein
MKTMSDRTFLVASRRERPERFAALKPKRLRTSTQIRQVLPTANRKDLWIVVGARVAQMLRAVNGPSRKLGRLLILDRAQPESIPALLTCFEKVVFITNGSGALLPAKELAEVLRSKDKQDLFIAGVLDPASETVTLWRGDFTSMLVPLSAFSASTLGLRPDFGRFRLTDYGHTLRFGEYEAAADAVLYEFDPNFRKRLRLKSRASERTFGAALRRLRKQRGLRREDFAPIAAKTIARIERGEIGKPRPGTLSVIAKRLGVAAGEIGSF